MATKKAPAKKNISSFDSPIQQVVTEETVNEKRSDQPTLLPPSQDDAFGVWNNNVKVVSTWGKAQDKNAFLNISGMGFKKIKETNEQAFLALLMLGTHARDKNSNINVRTETDGRIYEMYVW